jgi:hypothetical protein
MRYLKITNFVFFSYFFLNSILMIMKLRRKNKLNQNASIFYLKIAQRK